MGKGRYILCRNWAQKKTGVDRFCEAFGNKMPSASKRDGEEKKAASEDGESSTTVDVSASESEDIPEAKAAVVRRPTPKAVASKVLQPTPKGFAAKARPPAGPPPRHLAMGHLRRSRRSPSAKISVSCFEEGSLFFQAGKAKVFERRQEGERQAGTCVTNLWVLWGTGQHAVAQRHGPTPKVEPGLRDVAVPQHRGYSWSEAEGKAERKLERRRQRCYAQARQEVKEQAERKKKEKKVTCRTERPKGERHHRRDPDGEDREGRLPKVSRQGEHTFILKL